MTSRELALQEILHDYLFRASEGVLGIEDLRRLWQTLISDSGARIKHDEKVRRKQDLVAWLHKSSCK